MQFIKTPYLQLPDTDGITVMWETDTESTTRLLVWDALCPDIWDVQYSPLGEPQVFYGENGYMHRVKATGLKSEKDYCYQTVSCTKDSELTSERHVFRTKSPENGNLSFAVTSETGGGPATVPVMEKLVNSMATERPDFLLFVGDMVLDGRQKPEWDHYLFTPFRSLICHTPFYHCAGNHEYHSDYMQRFLATSEKGYYDFTYGCAHFIALDSTQLADHYDEQKNYYPFKLTQPLTEENPQVRFLIDSLKKSGAKWKFVYLHYPPYVAGAWQAAVLRPLCRIFEKYGVDIVFASHTKIYERSHPIRNEAVDFSKGVRYLVVGGAGECPEWFHHKKAWHTAKSRAIPHFVHVSITPEHMELQAIDLNGKLFDNLVMQKPDRQSEG